MLVGLSYVIEKISTSEAQANFERQQAAILTVPIEADLLLSSQKRSARDGRSS